MNFTVPSVSLLLFILKTFSEIGDISLTVTSISGTSFLIEIPMQPVPVHISKAVVKLFFLIKFTVVSTNISLSGLGVNTPSSMWKV